MTSPLENRFVVAAEDLPVKLGRFLRGRTGDRAWSEIKRWLATGKVFVDDRVEPSAGRELSAGMTVSLSMNAPRPRDRTRDAVIVFEDRHVVVINKPSGASSVPYDRRETGTAMDLLRDAWRRQGKRATDSALHVVHRIDKGTSGLLVFARSKQAERALGVQFRNHTLDRFYQCVAHGDVRSGRIESRLVSDRGDGLRGSTTDGRGKRAVTHVTAEQSLRGATLCRVRLETGKTHQIRIHLSESGHPIVGESVYVRDYEAMPIPCGRLLLHAARLGFEHPVTGEVMTFTAELPEDFVRALRGLTVAQRR